MNYAKIKKHDISNGPGVRVSLYVSGCTHHCKNCFNPETWDFSFGEPFDQSAETEILEALEPPYIKGLSLLGGEPFEPQNRSELADFVKKVRERYPGKSVWCYTGYDYEKDLLTGRVGSPDSADELLSLIDVLVDGEFIEEEKVIDLRFRGSENQRIIDVKKSLQADEVVLWSDGSGQDGQEDELPQK